MCLLFPLSLSFGSFSLLQLIEIGDETERRARGATSKTLINIEPETGTQSELASLTLDFSAPYWLVVTATTANFSVQSATTKIGPVWPSCSFVFATLSLSSLPSS